MNSLTLSRCALSVCAAVTLLVGCGGLQPVGVTQGSAPQGQMPENPSRVTGVRQSPRSVRHPSVTETVLHSFEGYPDDGSEPESGLTYFKGTLYGTTRVGGVYPPDTSSGYHFGLGTVYSITPSGTYTVLHSFAETGPDGALPEARLIVLKGTLYGTTLGGGGGGGQVTCTFPVKRYGGGTVFTITPSGQETVVHEFIRSREGWWPQAPLLNVNGTLYGTTCGGGGIHGGDGTAFTITPSGDEHAIYSFQGPGGELPSHGRLVDLNGTLYGTAIGGGKYGDGVVFSLSSSGTEKVLHSFEGGKDGANPWGGLSAIKQTLYGTTNGGGAYGDGTVFSITPSGTEKVLHSFNGSDGSGPVATLLNVNGTLYGTTSSGGAYNDGTVFSITLSGHETVLYSFMGQGSGGSGQDGADPQSGLTYLNGKLYGTTSSGGRSGYECYSKGCGTVFSITL